MELRWRYILVYLIAVPVYALLTLASPVDEGGAARFHLSHFAISIIQLTFIIPLILIWFAGLYGADRFRQYVATLRDGPPSAAMRTIVNGILLLVVGLIVSTMFSALRPYALQGGNMELFQIANTYLTLVFPLVSIYLIFRGSQRLLEAENIPPDKIGLKVLVGFALAVLLAVFVVLLFNNPYRNSTPDPARFTSFYLDDILIIGTILLPYGIAWLFGGIAALNLRHYARHLKRREHRTAFSRLSLAIFIIIAISIAGQILIILSSVLGELSIGSLLLVIYLLVALYGAGYLFLASGARRLQELSELSSRHVG